MIDPLWRSVSVVAPGRQGCPTSASLVLVVLFSLSALLSGANALCSIYNPGLPLANGVPMCPCGYAYVLVGCQSGCSDCGTWTTNGCKKTTNHIFSDPVGTSVPANPRCKCLSGACCDTSQAKSGLFLPSSSVCANANNAACTAASTCTGSSPNCPAQKAAAKGVTCRASAGPCDPAELCDGSSKSCPANKFLPATTVCNAALPSPTCDLEARCTGTSAPCPAKRLKAKNTDCNTGSGCIETAVCSGTSTTCPTRATKPNGAICQKSDGPCQNHSYCNGSPLTACPAQPFFPNTTVCNATTDTCYTNATCSGTSAKCNVIAARPVGSVCGNNTLCSKALDNVCDSGANCVVAQCPTCPNGMQGADCSCPAGPPTSPAYSSLNATCTEGTWYINGDFTGSLVIAPGTSVAIIGSLNIPYNDTITMGSGSHLNISDCFSIEGQIEAIYSPKFPDTAVVQFDPDCSMFVQNTSLTLTTNIIDKSDKCTTASSESSFDAPGLLNVLFSASSSCGKKKPFNYVGYVVAPVVAVAGLTAVAVAIIVIYKHHQEQAAKSRLS